MASSTPRKFRVLLIEDNPADARLMQEVLSVGSDNLQLEVIHDGQEAEKYLETCCQMDALKPDLVFLDLNLPIRDGRFFLKELKSNIKLRSIPVIVLTTSSADKDIAWAYDTQANSYITKPIDLDEFTRVVSIVRDYWFSVVRLPNE